MKKKKKFLNGSTFMVRNEILESQIYKFSTCYTHTVEGKQQADFFNE